MHCCSVAPLFFAYWLLSVSATYASCIFNWVVENMWWQIEICVQVRCAAKENVIMLMWCVCAYVFFGVFANWTGKTDKRRVGWNMIKAIKINAKNQRSSTGCRANLWKTFVRQYVFMKSSPAAYISLHLIQSFGVLWNECRPAAEHMWWSLCPAPASAYHIRFNFHVFAILFCFWFGLVFILSSGNLFQVLCYCAFLSPLVSLGCRFFNLETFI